MLLANLKKEEMGGFQYAAAKTTPGLCATPNADATLIEAGIEPFSDCCDASGSVFGVGN